MQHGIATPPVLDKPSVMCLVPVNFKEKVTPPFHVVVDFLLPFVCLFVVVLAID
jgi:hypothetical protein